MVSLDGEAVLAELGTHCLSFGNEFGYEGGLEFDPGEYFVGGLFVIGFVQLGIVYFLEVVFLD